MTNQGATMKNPDRGVIRDKYIEEYPDAEPLPIQDEDAAKDLAARIREVIAKEQP